MRMPQIEAQSFITEEELDKHTNINPPTDLELAEILHRAADIKGLSTKDSAVLLAVQSPHQLHMLLKTAERVKKEIYGNRMVLFAPLYTSSYCSNNCLYCGFRKDNEKMPRKMLTGSQLEIEVKAILAQGHKRVLLLCGEHVQQNVDHVIDSVQKIYNVTHNGHRVRRINVEVAPMSVDDFKKLAEAKIGTYTCFQETYDSKLYESYHPSGPKADYINRLYVMDRAMEAGIGDVGIGVLFGLADYKRELLSAFMHAEHLEAKFGVGPHTISVPRLEPADGSPLSNNVPHPVSDDEFRKIVSIIRIAKPYTGIILSTRESIALRNELFAYGVSQVSAGSKTDPGGYSQTHDADNGQFSLHDERSLEDVINNLVSQDLVPSFCTGCYRKGRVGNDFMDLAKPGLIKAFCEPNGLLSFAEFLLDFASAETRKKGFNLIQKLGKKIPDSVRAGFFTSLGRVQSGERDLYS